MCAHKGGSEKRVTCGSRMEALGEAETVHTFLEF